MLRATHKTTLLVGILWSIALTPAMAIPPPPAVPVNSLRLRVLTTLLGSSTAKGKAKKAKTTVYKTIPIQITTTGEYIIQTTGDTDTYCRLFNRTIGQIAVDNNSGEARNCRIIARLTKGTYRLEVRKEQRPVKVSVEAYGKQGGVEDIADGAKVHDTLRTGKYRTFRFQLKRRRFLSARVEGETLRHCRLFHHKGWPAPLTTLRTIQRRIYRRNYRRRRHRRSRYVYMKQCYLRGILEPGTYTLHAYGKIAALTKAKQAPLYVFYGARKLRPSAWRTLYINRSSQQRFWFRLPHSNEDQTLVFEAKTLRRRYGTWRITVRQQSWTQPHEGTLMGRCGGYRYTRSCMLVRKVKAGQRFTLSFYASRLRKIKFRYYSFQHTDTATLGRTAQQLALKGQMSTIKFKVKRAGPHWIQVKPAVKSCAISRTDRPLHKRLVLARGIALLADKTKTTSALTTKQGHTFWFQVPQSGNVSFETSGTIDTLCQLSSWHGDKIETDDDDGPGRNCRIQRHLKAGIYRFFVRIYRGPKQSWIKLHATHRSDKKTTKPPSTIKRGCAFVANLAPGEYKLDAPEAAFTGPRFTYIVAAKRKRRLRLPRTRAPRNTGILAPSQPQAISGTNWKRWLNLARLQTHTYRWYVPQTGFYTIHSLGHLLPRCRLVSQRDTLKVFTSSTRASHCHFTQRLTKGTYHLQLQAIRGTKGLVGLQVQRRKLQSLGTLRHKRFAFAQLKEGSVGQLQYNVQAPKTPKSPSHKAGIMSLDDALQCTLVSADGWPRQSGSCLFTFPKKAGLWKMFVHAPGKARLGMFAAANPLSPGRQRRRSNHGTRDPHKPVPLQLNASTRQQISVLGWDAYTFSLQSASLLALRLPPGFKARLFKNNKFVADIAFPRREKAKTTRSISLQAGAYRLVVRHKDGGTHLRYNLYTRIIAAAPNASFQVPTPTKLLITVPKRGVVDIGTTGLVDTWCSLEDSSGRLLGRNDDRDATRWDCKLSRLLNPGRYKLQIGGRTSRTRITIQQRSTKAFAAITAGKGHKAILATRQVHTRTYNTKQTVLATFSAKSKATLRCVLEHKGHVVQQMTGSRCQLRHLCRPGTYTWRVYSLNGKAARYQAKLQHATLPKLARGGTLQLPFHPQTPSHVALQVGLSGPHKLTLKGIAAPQQTRCTISQGGRSHTFPCQAPVQLTAGEHHLTIASLASSVGLPEKLQLGLLAAPLAPGQTRRIQVATATPFLMPIVAPKAGDYALAVQSNDDRRWGCAQHHTFTVSPSQTTRHKCHLVVRLRKGIHRFYMWRPKGYAGARGSVAANISLRYLKPSKAVRLAKDTHLIEHTLKAHQPRTWLIPQPKQLRVQLVLHGQGIAYMTWGNRIAGSCRVMGTTHCSWLTGPHGTPQALHVLPGNKPIHFRATLQRLPQLQRPQGLTLNSSKHLTPHSGKAPVAVWVAPKRTKRSKTIEAVGADKCIALYRDGVFREGCKQAIAGRHPVQFRAYGRRGITLAFYQAGKRDAALWNLAAPPQSNTKAAHSVLQPGPQTHPLSAKSAALSWFKVRTEGAPLRATATGGHLRCALFSAASEIITTHAGTRSCRIERALKAGTYWVGVRHLQGKALQGNFRAESLRMKTAKQGTSGPYLLGPDGGRWFRFRTLRTGLVGIGAVDQRDDLRCQLFDARHRFVAKGCQLHQKLTKGQYLLRVALPKGRPAAAFKLVLRGLNPPPAKPPRAFLKKLKRESASND